METNDRLTIREEYRCYGYTLIVLVKELQEKLDEGWDTACGGDQIKLFRDRVETDKEYNNRLKFEEREKQNRLKQYKELRKEFGDLV